MRLRWFTTKAVFLLLSIAACSANAATAPSCAVSQEPIAQLRFGQTIALSDFDADGLIDQAILQSWGAHRSIEVVLSRSGKAVVLCFDNGSADRGSLVAQDVDNDGAADLIWTDLLHADGVVVWLGNGNGQFSRVAASAYAGGFTLPDTSVNAPDETIRETSIGAASSRSLDEARPSTFDDRLASQLPQQRLRSIAALTPTLGEPTDRGPPLPVS
jgi:hypothetical protein